MESYLSKKNASKFPSVFHDVSCTQRNLLSCSYHPVNWLHPYRDCSDHQRTIYGYGPGMGQWGGHDNTWHELIIILDCFGMSPTFWDVRSFHPSPCRKSSNALDPPCSFALDPRPAAEWSDRPGPPRSPTKSTWHFPRCRFPSPGREPPAPPRWKQGSPPCCSPACDSWSPAGPRGCRGRVWPNACCRPAWGLALKTKIRIKQTFPRDSPWLISPSWGIYQLDLYGQNRKRSTQIQAASRPPNPSPWPKPRPVPPPRGASSRSARRAGASHCSWVDPVATELQACTVGLHMASPNLGIVQLSFKHLKLSYGHLIPGYTRHDNKFGTLRFSFGALHCNLKRLPRTIGSSNTQMHWPGRLGEASRLRFLGKLLACNVLPCLKLSSGWQWWWENRNPHEHLRL